MVAIAALGSATAELVQGLSPDDVARVEAALAYANEAYQDKLCSSGQGALEFSIGVASTLAFLRSDAETRIAGLLFEMTVIEPSAAAGLETRFGKEVTDLVSGVRQLIRLRDMTVGQQVTSQPAGRGKGAAQQAVAQVETLRKMLLAMATDMRVVLVRLASCVTTLR
jgi:GTP pyrophosphokinase